VKIGSLRHPCPPVAEAGTLKARAPKFCGLRVAAVVGFFILA